MTLYAQVCCGLTLDVICCHFDMVVKWPLRLTLASGLFWWVCLNISEYAPKASANMQFPTNFDHWGVLQPRIIVLDFRSASGFPWLPSPFDVFGENEMNYYYSHTVVATRTWHSENSVFTRLLSTSGCSSAHDIQVLSNTHHILPIEAKETLKYGHRKLMKTNF